MRLRPCAEVDQDQRRVAGLRAAASSVPRTSARRREGGDDQGHRRRHLLRLAVSSSRQRVRIDSESLPTGTLMPSAGHSSMPTALHRVVQRRVFAAGSPHAAIQLQHSLTRVELDRRGQQVGDRLADRHAARRRRVERGERRALAHAIASPAKPA